MTMFSHLVSKWGNYELDTPKKAKIVDANKLIMADKSFP